MADTCLTLVDIKGPDDLLGDLRGMIAGVNESGEATLLSLSRLMPIPTGLDDTVDVSIWCQRNWGCRSEPWGVELIASPGELRYRMETPYSPPTPWFQALGRSMPELSIRVVFVIPSRNLMAWMDIRGETTDAHILESPGSQWLPAAREELRKLNAGDLLPG